MSSTHRDFGFTLSTPKLLLRETPRKPHPLIDQLLDRQMRLAHDTAGVHGIDQNDPVSGYPRNLGSLQGNVVHRRMYEKEGSFRGVQLVNQLVYRKRRVRWPVGC